MKEVLELVDLIWFNEKTGLILNLILGTFNKWKSCLLGYLAKTALFSVETVMPSKNQHIHDYLSYYRDLKARPEYAVLIKGSWGCGKTWFIRDFFNKQTSNNYLYVSLYGISSIEEIENEFFRQLHPFLASKGMKLLGKLTKGFLKATIHIDINNDGKPDVNLESSIPNEDLARVC